MAWLFLLLFGIVSSNLLPGDKRLGHHHHHHHHQEHHHNHQSPPDQHHHAEEEEHQHHHHEEEPEHHHHHTDHGGGHNQHHPRSGKNLADIDFTSATLDQETGLKCVRTEETLKTVEREKLLSCTHSSINICHYTYVTKFSPFRPEVCDDVYSKRCTIVFSKRAEEAMEEHCYRPWTRKCEEVEGEEGNGEEGECRRVSETWCVRRYSGGLGRTSCDKIPQTLCSPANCKLVQEEEKCHNKSVTVVNEFPDESCDIVPSKICRNVNKLVPHLEPVQECKDQPRQVCSYGLKSPSSKEKPLITKWCYNDNDEGGIFGEKLIKKDRKPKSNSFKTKNIPSSLLISTNPLVPPIQNILTDDVTEPITAQSPSHLDTASQSEGREDVALSDGDVNDRVRQRHSKILGNKLLSQSLLPPPLTSGPTKVKDFNQKTNPALSEKPLSPSGGDDDQNLIINDTQSDHDAPTTDEEFDEFIDTILDRVKQDPENSVPGEETDGEDVDTNVIADVLKFDEDGKEVSTKSQLSISKELRPDERPIAKVLKHDNASPVSKTIIIQNNPRAHKIFGVRNPPKKFSPELLSVLTTGDDIKDIKDIGQRKSKSGAKTISRDHSDDTRDLLLGQRGTGFSFGISDITKEEREQYGSAASAEFNFKSDWNNKAPPPGLVLFRKSEETSTDNGLHHKMPDDTNSHNNDQHNLHRPFDLDNNFQTFNPESFSNDNDVSTFENQEFDPNNPFVNNQNNLQNKLETFRFNNEVSELEDPNTFFLSIKGNENSKSQNKPFNSDNIFETFDPNNAFIKDFNENQLSSNSQQDGNIQDLFISLDSNPMDPNQFLPTSKENGDQSLIVSQGNQLLTSNSFKTFPLIQDNSASTFPRIPDGPIDIHNSEHNRVLISSKVRDGRTGTDINGVASAPSLKINDGDIKSSRLQSQDDRSDYYSHGQNVDDSEVSDGDSVILLLHDKTGKELPTPQYEGVITSPHQGIQSEPGTNPNSITNNRLVEHTASTVTDYDTSPYSRQHLPSKQKYFQAEEIGAIPPGLTLSNTGPRPVGNAITVENLRSMDPSRGHSKERERGGALTASKSQPTPSSIDTISGASDKFRAPSTLLYGFKPMTTTEKVALSGASRPINYYKPTPQVPSDPPVKYKPAYKPTRKPKNFVLEAISSLLHPITQTISNLLRG